MRNGDTATASPPPKIKGYRPDIDGLRTLAVLPVLLFHANLFPDGGFVGVDIFFVISGYLITKIIDREITAGNFSIASFYTRRIKRIFPAMFLMLLATTITALFVLTASEIEGYGISLLGVTTFLANIVYYGRSGYFDASAELNPLLHMWTLSVEEQFYIFWPLLFMLLALPLLRKWKTATVIAIILASLALSVYWTHTDPRAAYFLLPSRAYELAIGALAALISISTIPHKIKPWVNHVASLLGLSLLVFSFVTYTRETLFPGFAGLAPSLGAALLILSSETRPSIVGKALSFKPMVWVGLISYSLYIWHWPILVFARMISLHELAPIERLGCIGLTFVLAWLSWKYVEVPVRHVRFPKWDKAVWISGGTFAIIAFATLGLSFKLLHGLPQRSPAAHAWYDQVSVEYQDFMITPCLSRNEKLPAANNCLLGKPSNDASYNAILWGDSHAMQFAPLINRAGADTDLTFRVITKAGCAPIEGPYLLPRTQELMNCETFKKSSRTAIQSSPDAKILVISARWDPYVDGTIGLSQSLVRLTQAQSEALFVSSLRDTLTEFASIGAEVILIGQVPLPEFDTYSCITRAKMLNQTWEKCKAIENHKIKEINSLTTGLLSRAISGYANVQLLSPYDKVCDDAKCYMARQGGLAYMDSDHLSSFGTMLLYDDMNKALKTAKGRIETREQNHILLTAHQSIETP